MSDLSTDDTGYARLRDAADREVAWWSRASGLVGSPLPLAAERTGAAPGTVTAEGLPERPDALRDGEYALGFRTDSRIVVLLRGTSFPDRAYETFVTWEPDAVRLDAFGYSDLKARLSATHIDLDGGRPLRAATTTGESERTETFVYESGRLTHVDVVTTGQDGTRTPTTLVVDYAETGEIAGVRTRHANGYEATTYARPATTDLSALLAVVEDGLVLAIPPTVERAGAADAVAVALAYSLEGPPLPPLLGILTASEHTALAAASDDPWDAWNPADYRLFDVPETAISLSPTLAAACEAVNAAVRSGADGRGVVDMLNRTARRLNALPWTAGVVVFATDLEGADASANVAAAVSPEHLAALRAAGQPAPLG